LREKEETMRLLKIISIFFISFILIIPLSTKAQVPPPSEIPEVIPVEKVQKFIVEYKVRFMKMDLDAFMDLFSKEAVENRMLPYADIREAYRRTIAHSKSIIYNLKIYSIQTYTRSAFVRGRYEIIQSLKKGGRKRAFKGDIQWDLVRENGSLKIREVNYGGERL
jgi:hypothetical protein